MGGAVVQWIVEELKLADSPAAAQALAESVPDSNGVVFVPALTGLGAPEWDPLARGAIFGLTRGANRRAHRARGDGVDPAAGRRPHGRDDSGLGPRAARRCAPTAA